MDQAGWMSSLCVGHLLEEPLQVLTGASMDRYEAAIFIWTVTVERVVLRYRFVFRLLSRGGRHDMG